MLGNIGVIAAVLLLIVFALRGVNVIIASLLCAALVALTNGKALASSLSEDYSTALVSFVGHFFLLFVSGAVFGRVMAESRAALSVSSRLGAMFGPERTLLTGVVVCALLTYGGVNVFIVIFTVYPLGLGLMRQANIPKRLFMAATSLGAGTFTMTALPGSPSLHNVLMADSLKTSLLAGPVLGIVAAVLMLAFGLTYLEFSRRRAVARGEGFVAAITDVLPEEGESTSLPPWPLAAAPMVVVLVTIIGPQLVSTCAPSLVEGEGVVGKLLRFQRDSTTMWTTFAMVLATVTTLVLLRRYISSPVAVLGRGAESAVLPLINTGVIIGFGGVVKGTEIFSSFTDVMLDSGLAPTVSAAVSVNVMSGIVGSAIGGLGIFAQSLAPHYLEAGVDPEVLHRIVAIAAGGLDSLPHCGAIITTLTIMGLKHRDAYWDTAVVTVVVPLLSLGVLLIGMAALGML